MHLYDPALYVWQDEKDQFYISYNPQRLVLDKDVAQSQIAYTVPSNDDGSKRMPDIRDLHALMRNDSKHQKMESIFDRTLQSQRVLKDEKRRRAQEDIRESLYGLTLAGKRRPSLFS